MAVRVNITLPNEISLVDGVYVGVKVLPPINVPVPLVDQLTPALFNEYAPFKVYERPSQILTGKPAKADGPCAPEFIVKFCVDMQPLPSVISNSLPSTF